MYFEHPTTAWKFVLMPKLHHMKERTKSKVKKTARTVRKTKSKPHFGHNPKAEHNHAKVKPEPVHRI